MKNPDNPKNSADAKSAELPASHLHRRYIGALLLIALLIILSQVVVQWMIADQVQNSHIVKIAGKQGLLSQKITNSALNIGLVNSAETAENYRSQLTETLANWQRVQIGLQKGDSELGLPGNNSSEIEELFQTITPKYQAIVSAADLILTSPDDNNALKTAIKSLQQNDADFLLGMEAIVLRYQQEGRCKAMLARWIELGLMTATLIVLLLVALLVFAPATRRLRRGIEELADSAQDLEHLFDASPTAMLMVDMGDLSILRTNQKALELTGLSSDELRRQSLANLLHSDYETNRLFVEKLRGDKALNEFEVALLDTNHDVIESVVSSRIINFADRSVYVLGFTNINELKNKQQSLEYYATYDELTGLVNRRTGLMFLEKSMARSWRESSPLSVIYADLEGLKTANDTFGHTEGDRLIRAAANIMTGLIRTSDFAVRLGGDDFLIILPNCASQNAQRIVENLEHLLASIKSDSPRHVVYSISCGVATYSADRHSSTDELIAEAAHAIQLKQGSADLAAE